MSSDSNNLTREASIAGAGTGSALAALIGLLGEGTVKSALLILAPSLAVIVAAAWSSLVAVINDKFADLKIRAERKRAERMVREMENDPHATDELKEKAKKTLQALRILELEASQKRIQTVLAQ